MRTSLFRNTNPKGLDGRLPDMAADKAESDSDRGPNNGAANVMVNPEPSAADKALAQMGYQPVNLPLQPSRETRRSRACLLTRLLPWQVFRREFSMWSTFSFALSISGMYATIMTTFSYPLYAGGAPSAVWSWLIAGFGAMCLALSVAEIMSAYPTSGRS